MELNHLLLFVAIASPLVVLVQLRGAERKRGWRIASMVVLFVTLISWLLVPSVAGYLGGCVWLAFLFLPAIGLHRVADLVARQCYPAARRFINLSRVLHPTNEVREQAQLIRALELAQRGEIESAIAAFSALRSDTTSIGRHATAQVFRLKGDWNGLLAWCRSLSPEKFLSDYALLPLYFRALGETHALDDLVSQFSARAQVLGHFSQATAALNFSLLSVLAFCGRTPALADLLHRHLPRLPRAAQEFWIGTSELAAGEYSAGRARLEKLVNASDDAVIRRESTSRLGKAGENSRAISGPLERKADPAAGTHFRKATHPFSAKPFVRLPSSLF